MKGILGGLSIGWLIGMVIIFVPASEIILDDLFNGSEIDPSIKNAVIYGYPRLIFIVFLAWLVKMVWPTKKEASKTRNHPCQCGSGCFTGSTCDYCGIKSDD